MKGAVHCMLSLVTLTMILVSVITLLTFVFRNTKGWILIPVSISMISILLLNISFIVGGWEGMGLGAVSIALFIASIISLILTLLLGIRSHNNY